MTDENHEHTMPLAEPLTAREQEVLSLVGQGRTNRQIAEELVLAHGTVRWYLRQIYAKLGVEGRREAVARARALGLIAAPAGGPAANTNLPAAATPLVGRQAELQELDKWLLDPHARLLTI
ncbi:MAG: helix-turn-helix domain-containing protein, partial [Chloroflexota bacterium]